MNKNNPKAGVANLFAGIAGLATVVMTVGSLYATGTVAVVLFYSNIVLFAIFVLASILASVFYLDFLQSFLTCTIFSADTKTPVDNEYFNKYARRYLFENRTKKLTKDYKREELNAYKRSIPMSDFRNMLQWLINLQCCFGGKGRLHGYDEFNYQGVKYRYPYFVTFKLQFRYFMPNTVLDLHLELYPIGLSRPDSSIIIPADGNAGTNYVDREDNGFFSVERTFRVGRKINQLLDDQKYTTQTLLSLNSCCYILFARIASFDDSRLANKYPYSLSDETLYVAFYEPLFVKYPCTNGAEISRYSGQRHAAETGKSYFSVGEREVLIGTKQEIYNQIRPLNFR